MPLTMTFGNVKPVRRSKYSFFSTGIQSTSRARSARQWPTIPSAGGPSRVPLIHPVVQVKRFTPVSFAGTLKHQTIVLRSLQVPRAAVARQVAAVHPVEVVGEVADPEVVGLVVVGEYVGDTL